LVNNVSEQCDDGNLVDGDGCSALCVTEFCGDGVVNNVSEQCDDGNLVGGDGCEADCTIGFVACDITAATCGTGESCYPTSAGDICLPTGTGTEGSVCGSVNGCGAGLGCVAVPTDAVNTYCRPLCDEGSGVSCVDGNACIGLTAPSNLGGCLLDSCDLYASACPSGSGCYPTTVYGDVCWLAGAGAAGTACSNYTDCVAGTTCVEDSPGGPAFCREICDLGNPVCSGVEVCTATTGSYGACQ
jgi:cysteine-rich repeat protein